MAQSIFKTGFGPKNAYEAALDWKRTISDIRAFGAQVAPGAFLEIRYEDLLADPVGTMGRVADSLGIVNHTDVIAAAAPRLRAYVRGNNASKWRQQLTWREIECFEAFAGDELHACGYALEFRPRTRTRSALESWFWQAQGVWRRVVSAQYWADNWYKLGLRAPRRVAVSSRVVRPWARGGPADARRFLQPMRNWGVGAPGTTSRS